MSRLSSGECALSEYERGNKECEYRIESRARLLDMATFGCGVASAADGLLCHTEQTEFRQERWAIRAPFSNAVILNISKRYIRQVLAGGAAQVSAGLSPRGVIALL